MALAFADANPPHLVVAQCLHAVGSTAESLPGAVRLSESERAEWVDEQWSPVVRFLAEYLLRDAGLVKETPAERKNDSGPSPGP